MLGQDPAIRPVHEGERAELGHRTGRTRQARSRHPGGSKPSAPFGQRTRGSMVVVFGMVDYAKRH